MKLMNKTLVMAVLALGSVGLAGGTDAGNGGDESCSEYVQTVRRIANALMNVGQETVDSVNKIIQVQQVYDSSKLVRCLPVNQLDRTARTKKETTGEIITQLNWKKWKTLNKVEKTDLSAHELSVGMDLEGEGDYSISTDITAIVKSTKFFAELKCSSLTRVGSATVCSFPEFIWGEPRAETKILLDSDEEGVCKYLGFNKFQAKTIGYTSRFGFAIELNSNGYPFGDLEGYDYLFYDSITCSD